MVEEIQLGNHDYMSQAGAVMVSAHDDGFYAMTSRGDGWLIGLRLLGRRQIFEVVEEILIKVEVEDETGSLHDCRDP
jgi:hypothetical protein